MPSLLALLLDFWSSFLFSISPKLSVHSISPFPSLIYFLEGESTLMSSSVPYHSHSLQPFAIYQLPSVSLDSLQWPPLFKTQTSFQASTSWLHLTLFLKAWCSWLWAGGCSWVSFHCSAALSLTCIFSFHPCQIHLGFIPTFFLHFHFQPSRGYCPLGCPIYALYSSLQSPVFAKSFIA